MPHAKVSQADEEESFKQETISHNSEIIDPSEYYDRILRCICTTLSVTNLLLIAFYFLDRTHANAPQENIYIPPTTTTSSASTSAPFKLVNIESTSGVKMSFPLKPSNLVEFPGGLGLKNGKLPREAPNNSCPTSNKRGIFSPVVGAYNVGTNMLWSMINSTCMELHKLLDDCNGHSWKHLPWFHNTLSHIIPDLPIIAITKDPLTWFQSVCKQKYELIQMDDNTDCYEAAFHSKWKWRGKIYDNLYEIWDEYYRTILNQTLSGRRQGKVMFVRYEDLLVDTDSEMTRVCDFLGLEKHTSGAIHDGAYKKHGHSSGLQSALNTYLKPGYRYRFNKLELELFEEQSDPNLLAALGYQFETDMHYQESFLRGKTITAL